MLYILVDMHSQSGLHVSLLWQVTLVHVNAVAKNAADDKLRQSLRRFAHTYPAPSTVVLVSSDVNFSSELNDLRHVHNMTIVLVHSQFTSDALKVFAHQLVEYEQFLEDVEAPKETQVLCMCIHVHVYVIGAYLSNNGYIQGKWQAEHSHARVLCMFSRSSRSHLGHVFPPLCEYSMV